MCALQHKEGGGNSILYFATWSELQEHQRKSHPPTCNWPACGRTFANTHNLRLHVQRHEAREKGHRVDDLGDDIVIDAESEDDEPSQILQPIIFPCSWIEEGKNFSDCRKIFRSKYAREVHMKNQHLGLKEYICSHADCTKKYGNKRSLNRHLLKCTHRGKAGNVDSSAGESADDEETINDDFFRQEGGAVPESSAERPKAIKRVREGEGHQLGSLLTSLTGRGYGQPKSFKKRKMRGRVVACPWSKICFLRDGTKGEGFEAESCPFRFSRLYDVQRHLEATHGINLLQSEISTMISKEEESQLATPCSGSNEVELQQKDGGNRGGQEE